MKIKITKKHIKNGIPCTSDLCPVALALFDKGFKEVCVQEDSVETDTAFFSIRRGRAFINRFDNELPVKPCTIELTYA